jgi:hypothetical protein
VDAFFWAALGFLVVSAVGGAVFVGVRAWRAWVVFTSFAAGGAANLEALAARVELASGKADRAAAKVAELEEAVARLQRATRQVRILVDALSEVRATVRMVRLFLPV